MKILYVDYLYPLGHKRQNETYINLLSSFAQVYVVCPKNYYRNLAETVTVIEDSHYTAKDLGKIKNRITFLKRMKFCSYFAKKLGIDYIFVSSFDTIAFSIGRLFYKNTQKFYLLHHINLDELSNKWKYISMSMYAQKVYHIVFEDYMANYLRDTLKVDKKVITVLPHQLNQNQEKSKKDYEKYDCVGLSNSNEEELIHQIILLEKENGYLKKNHKRVLLKSHNLLYDNGYLKVINGFLDDEEYNFYISNCCVIYLPFRESFVYRMSGTLVDALSNRKIVFASNIRLLQEYKKEYPHVCYLITHAKEFMNHIIAVETSPLWNTEFDLFQSRHSNKIILDTLKRMFYEEAAMKKKYKHSIDKERRKQ